VQQQNCVDLAIRSRVVTRACQEAREAAAARSFPQGTPAAAPPVGNTGGKLTVLCDHFNATVGVEKREMVASLLSPLLGEGEELGYGFHSYQRAMRWQTGALLLWSPDRPECCLSLNGDSLEAMGPRQVFGLFYALWSLGVKSTRFDATADDYSRMFSMEDVHAAAEGGNFTRFRKFTPIRERERVGGQVRLTSDSIRFGRRGKGGGGVSVIFYDKLLESDGERDANRVEATYSKESAEVAWLVLTQDFADGAVDDAAYEKFTQRLAHLVASSIDFRERGDETHIDRMPRLAWWEKFVAALGEGVRCSVVRSAVPLVKTIRACISQYVKKLAVARVVAQSKGQDLLTWLNDQLDAAERVVDWKKMGRLELDFELDQCVA
jgi:hypothetical protein